MEELNIHILMIEDNEFDALLIQHRLQQRLKDQITLTHAASIADALQFIRQKQFDLIISDLHLPDSMGVETVTTIKQYTDVPIVVLTVSKNEQLAMQCINAGAYDYLEKDVLSENSLIRVVHYSIERQRSEERTEEIRRRFQTIFEKAPLGIAHINLNNETFIDINPRYAFITGRSIDELMQRKQSDLIHPDDAQAYKSDMLFFKRNMPENWKISRRIMHSQGATIWVEMTFAPYEVIHDGEVCYVCMMEDITEHKAMLNRLRELTLHLQNVREEESIRIGREVHDIVGGNLAVIKLELDWLSKKVTEESLNEHIRLLHQLTSEAIESVRDISSNLRPNVLDNLGLEEAIDWVARDFEQRVGICCSVGQDYVNFPVLASEKETTIFRVIQEALINIAQHADASSVEIDLFEMDAFFVSKLKIMGSALTWSNNRISALLALWACMNVRNNLAGY